jgi:alkylhydroperoxidase family enzyme
LARHPDLLRRWLVFGTHVLAKSTLSARHRELLILRVGWLCRAPYEWGQHVVIARREGITDAEIARIAEGPDAAGWDPFEAVLMRATDELPDQCITDHVATSVPRTTSNKCLDVIFTVGQYTLVSMALNSCGVERDDGVDVTSVPFPPRASRRDTQRRRREPIGIFDHRVVAYAVERGERSIVSRLAQPQRHGMHGDRIELTPDDPEWRGMTLDGAGEASLVDATVLDVADESRQKSVAVVGCHQLPLGVELIGLGLSRGCEGAGGPAVKPGRLSAGIARQ